LRNRRSRESTDGKSLIGQPPYEPTRQEE
jgi:hypothetical protein